MWGTLLSAPPDLPTDERKGRQSYMKPCHQGRNLGQNQTLLQ